MKKITILSLSLFLLGATIITACKKDECSTCVIKDSSGKELKNYGQKCGTKKDLDDYEASAKADAPQYGGTCTCERK